MQAAPFLFPWRRGNQDDVAELTPLLAGYLVFVALVTGSFINLAADRLPRGESVVRPRSHCRACGRQLNPIDLLPVAGYLLRGGRCATCGSQIGKSAPIVEALSGTSMLASIAWLGVWPGALVGLMAVLVLGTALVGFATRRRMPLELPEGDARP